MHLNEDISNALELLEQLKDDIAKCQCPELESTTCPDLHLLISALENPALRGQAILQDSLGHLRQQLLQDPQLTVDGFDITFAGRLLLDDGHYSEPVYESADEGIANKVQKHRNLPPPAGDKNQLNEESNKINSKANKPSPHGGDQQSRYSDRKYGSESRSPRGGPRHPWEAAGIHHPLTSTPAALLTAPPPPTPPPATPVLSIPLQTTPVLLAPQSPAILLQIPLLTPDTAAATAGLTINDLYLGRLTPEHQVPPTEEGAVAALLRASSVDSDRSANGSDTASSVNSGSGWSKSSSIVRVSYGDDGGDRMRCCIPNEPKRYTETSPEGGTPTATRETGSPLLPSTPDHLQRRPSPTAQPYPHPCMQPRPYPYPYPHPSPQHHLQPLPIPSDDFHPLEEAVWSPSPTTIELVKGGRGLGFSIGEQRHPPHPRGAVVVVRSLVEGGVAQVDGRLRPGDRLVAVNGRPLTEGSLDEAVHALKGAPLGLVTVGVLRRVWRETGLHDEDHYEEIDERNETRARDEQGESLQDGVGDEEVVVRPQDTQKDGDREAEKIEPPTKPKLD